MSATGWMPVDEATKAWTPVNEPSPEETKKQSLARNAQPTKFEKQRSMAPQEREANDFLLGAAHAASGLPETLNPVKDAFSAPPPKPSFWNVAKASLGPGADIAENAIRMGRQLFSPRGENEDPEDAAIRRAHGAGEAVGTIAPAVLGEGVSSEVGATRSAVGKTLVDPMGQAKPLPRLVLGNDRAKALGEIIGPESPLIPEGPNEPVGNSPYATQNKARMEASRQAMKEAASANEEARKPVPVTNSPYYEQNKAKMAAEAADREPVPLSTGPNANLYRAALKAVRESAAPKPELGSPENPGFMSELPKTMPKPQFMPMSEGPSGNQFSIAVKAARDLLKPQPPEIRTTPFGQGMTPTNALHGNAELPQVPANIATQGPKFVKQFEKPTPPEPSKIVSPDSPAPPIGRELTNYPREALYELAKKGDLDAIKELQRNPARYQLPPNAKYLFESAVRAMKGQN